MSKRPSQVKIVNPLPNEMKDHLIIHSCNVTTPSKKNHEVLASKVLEPNEPTIPASYGSGPLSFKGSSNADGTIIIAQNSSASSPSYLVRVEGTKAFDKLEKAISKNLSNLSESKISNSQAIFGVEIPNGIDTENLIAHAMESQQSSTQKRMKVSLTAKGTLEIGSKNSTKSVQVGLVRDLSTPPKKCLCILSITKETNPQWLINMQSSNLDLSDIHVLNIRNSAECLNDCNLKDIMLSAMKKEFSLPPKEKINSKKAGALPSKLKFLNSAFNSSFNYLDNPELKDLVKALIESYLEQLKAKGFAMSSSSSTATEQTTSELGIEDSTKATDAQAEESSEDTVKRGRGRGGSK
uniref:Uncharacterized protein n=1 Tax=Pediastrum angulosum TaxID=271408 RepID=A0A2U8GHH1_9CHLO|nr:hypothetical protein [Pediastrum angulosum]YP_009492024.1 hypothetical protein [Pediastrum angulosum]AWI68123.1 hypothetical protein [Pediastrum angulosum]AWI68124.1 hypothetical protein [Pediastrum angulosum]